MTPFYMLSGALSYANEAENGELTYKLQCELIESGFSTKATYGRWHGQREASVLVLGTLSDRAELQAAAAEYYQSHVLYVDERRQAWLLSVPLHYGGDYTSEFLGRWVGLPQGSAEPTGDYTHCDKLNAYYVVKAA